MRIFSQSLVQSKIKKKIWYGPLPIIQLLLNKINYLFVRFHSRETLNTASGYANEKSKQKLDNAEHFYDENTNLFIITTF